MKNKVIKSTAYTHNLYLNFPYWLSNVIHGAFIFTKSFSIFGHAEVQASLTN
jgi:hypothetical protein